MFGEDRKVWQAIWRITTGKYLPDQLFLIIYIFEKQIWMAGSFCAPMVQPCRLVPRFLFSFRFEESKT
jgi:hypothetical protein